MKLVIKYPPEYKTPIRIEEAEDLEEAWDREDEVKQGFGQALILTDKQWEELRLICQIDSFDKK